MNLSCSIETGLANVKGKDGVSFLDAYLGVRGEILCNFKQIYVCLHIIK